MDKMNDLRTECSRVLAIVQELETRLLNRSFEIRPLVQVILKSLPQLKFMSWDVPDEAFEFYRVIVKLGSVVSVIDELAVLRLPVKFTSVPDYDSMSPEDIEFYGTEFRREYENLARENPDWSVPVLDMDGLPLSFIHRHRDRLVADLARCSCVRELCVLREALSEYDRV